jgi:hypothetical protein
MCDSHFYSNPRAEKDSKRRVGQRVKLKAVIVHVADCGKLGLRIEQPGGHAVVVVEPAQLSEE